MTTNTTSGKRIRTPAVIPHHRTSDLPGSRAGVEVREFVAGGTLGRCPGDGEVAVKENLPLTG